MKTNNQAARIAGFLYLMYIIITIAADVLGRAQLIVYGDATATAQHIMASTLQFQLGITSDLVSAVLFFLAAWALYVLLKPVHSNLALLFLLLNLTGVAVYSLNLLNQFAAVLLLSGAEYLKVFQADQQQALAMLLLVVYRNGYWIAQLFFGAWLFPLGYLVFKSGFLPRILGVILMIHCVGWLLTFLQFFLLPSFTALTMLTYPLGFLSECGLTLWLLIMGARDQTPAGLAVGRAAHLT